jgi:hypothetical protein
VGKEGCNPEVVRVNYLREFQRRPETNDPNIYPTTKILLKAVLLSSYEDSQRQSNPSKFHSLGSALGRLRLFRQKPVLQ